ncbi:phosphatase PAP2 family protein [Plantactinospora sp. CA-290183]|uniref:phosphatase PAP2 family protein n=1 Tax=Plantactinospora sp. CA-290183 TaxID=3240006 RepID=UPI003D8ECBF9
MTRQWEADSVSGPETAAVVRARSWWVRTLLATALLGTGTAAMFRLAPGGLGDAAPIEVTDGASVSVYRWALDSIPGAPDWTAVELAGEAILILLVLLLGWVCWSGVRRSVWPSAVAAGLTLVGTLAAYLCSEAVKLVVDQQRPCRAVPGVPVMSHCPEIGDWSFPSNHATIAGALAIGLVLARPRLAALALPLAVLAALSRVVGGVHYPHDVLAGLLLGATLCAAVVIVLTPPVVRLVARRRPPPGGPA